MDTAITIFISGNAILVIGLIFYMFNTKSKVANINHKYVLVTGCDSGFGRAIVEELDQKGVNVFAGCLSDSSVKELKVLSKRIIPFVFDVSNSEHIKDAVAFVEKKLPKGQGLWGLVNNAGIARSGFIEWLSIDSYRKVADVNLFGLIEVTNNFLPLIKRNKGRIVNMASVAGILATPFGGPYNVSKFGVIAFNNTLRIEMMAFGIGVHCICPTFFRTNIIEAERNINSLNATYNAASDEVKESYKGIPEKVGKAIKRVISRAPEDLSPVVDAVEDALFNTKPKSYYYIGDGSFIFRMLPTLPTDLGDWIFTKLNPLFRPSMIQK